MWRRPLQTGPWGGRGGSCCCCRCCWRPRGGPGQGPASPRRPARRVCDRTRDAPGARTRSSRGGGRADAPRCAPREALERAGCPPGAVVQPRGSVRVLRDRAPGGGPGGPTQLSPQSVRVQLRPGEERSFPVRFRRAAAPPVDLYYLLDLSYSMRDDLGTLRRLARDILGTLRNATPAARIGFGSFVDKPVLPYVSTAPAKLRSPCPGRGEPCDPPRAFRHLLPLTGDPELFAQRVARQRVSGNLDAAEGGFDAIVQVAQCQERIGWRAAARLLLFASDDTFHAAGDGKLGGIVNPCDGRCHLDHSGVYASSHLYDYPSVGHVAQVLSAANIQPIFAVTGPNVPIYQELSRLIPRSVVRELRDDSSNVVQLIADAYSSLLSTVELQHSPLPPGISLSLEAHCGGPPGPPRPHGASCTGVRVNQEVTFTVRVRAGACLESPQRVTLRALGVPEELALELGRCARVRAPRARPAARGATGGRCSAGSAGVRGGAGAASASARRRRDRGGRGNCPPNSTSAPCSGACERHQGCPAEARSAASACAGRAAAARVRRPRLRVSPGRGALPAGGARVQRPTELRVRDLPLPPRLRGTVLRALSLLPPALPAPAGLRRLRRLRAGAAAGELQPGLPPRHRAGGPRAPPGSRGWCRQETPDGRVLLFLIEGGPRGDEWDEEREVTLLVWAEQGAAVLPALVAALVAAPVALGMVALALARAALELRGRRETRREQNNLLFRSATSTTANPGYRPD
ncbi:integrin beta-7 isoform X1 [Columba livia]|uniref:integrin beta-7 isoform X1 n=1 Tax=Columba livia TaxID=8932 RepID=UPI0031BAAC33